MFALAPIQYVDVEDAEYVVNTFKTLDEMKALKHVMKVNIHGANLNPQYKKEICEICHKNNIPVSLNLPNFHKLVKAKDTDSYGIIW
jgi:ABC-type phosphate/phosphonate transport system ATPase subunit